MRSAVNGANQALLYCPWVTTRKVAYFTPQLPNCHAVGRERTAMYFPPSCALLCVQITNVDAQNYKSLDQIGSHTYSNLSGDQI